VESALLETIAWFEPRALLFAVILPPVIRVVGHWIPEELFMVSVGIVIARSDDVTAAALLLAALLGSQFVTDQTTFAVGRAFGPRLRRFERLEPKLRTITTRLERSPLAVLALVPARVLPLWRGAWLVGCGLTRIPWRRFAAVNVLALLTHLVVWAGLGWWLADDLMAVIRSTEQLRQAAVATAMVLAVGLMLAAAWHQRRRWLPSLAPVVAGLRSGPFPSRD
jgi:membrane protein DedA with SNARE-associated domain